MQLVHRRRFPVDHFVLIDTTRRVPTAQLIAEAHRRAGELSLRATGDREHFTLIHNGSGLARRAAPHVHIVCARSYWQKALIYFFIGAKNLLADLRRR